MRILIRRLRLPAAFLLLCAFPALAQPAANTLVNAASYGSILAPGVLAALFGTQLAPATQSAPGVPLPYSIGGVSVAVGGLPAPLLFVSPGQINLLIPFETQTGVDIPVVVATPTGSTAPLTIRLVRNAPALFTWNRAGTGAAIAFDPNFQPIANLGTAPIVLYATGLGPTDPPPASSADGGLAAPPYNTVTDDLQVMIGELPCTVQFAGLAPGLPGVYQLNVAPPANPQSNRLYLSMNGVSSNAVTLPIPVGTNVANVSGVIEGLYPASGVFATLWGGSTSGPIAISEMLTAATIGVAFDILPGAQPFTVTATSPAGNAVFQIDPIHGSCQGTAPSPVQLARFYDFSLYGFQVYDLQYGFPFPNDIVPLSRLDPIASSAAARIGLPTVLPASPSPNGAIVISTCPLDSRGHFAIGSNDGQSLDLSNYGLSYGGFINLGRSPAASQTAGFRLFVDGLLVASRDLVYQVYQH